MPQTDTTTFGQQPLSLWEQALDIWSKGGWAMWALASLAIMMFGLGIHIWLRLREKRFDAVREDVWRGWIDYPSEREGPIGKLLDFATAGQTLKETRMSFGQLHATETAPFERDLRVMRILVSAAPLVGLLGTVTGMLTTFNALATGSGGDETMSMIAGGISEALVTTETGLVIALPGLFFQYQLSRKFDRYRAFLAHLETVCTQTLHGRMRAMTRATARRAAAQQIAETLRKAVS